MSTRGLSRHGLALAAVLALVGVGAGQAWGGARVVPRKEVSGVLNLNTATAQQLDLLPGVGAKSAKRIVEFRAKTPFARAEDLARVKGFSPKKLAVLRPFLTVTGPTTLAVKAGAAPGAGKAPPH
jgi:competence protein ComEA